MEVIYRLSPFLSSHPNPLGNDKFKIVNTCLQSFLNYCDHTKHKITFICDSVPDDWMKYISPYGEVIRVTDMGNVGTFQYQLDLASKSEGKVFLVEDDYLWRGKIETLERALDELDFVSPYDHPSHYDMWSTFEIRNIDGTTYRTAPSNTLTFAGRSELFRDNLEVMKSFGISDHPMFNELNNRGVKNWTPCYSQATHLVTTLIAPHFNL